MREAQAGRTQRRANSFLARQQRRQGLPRMGSVVRQHNDVHNTFK